MHLGRRTGRCIQQPVAARKCSMSLISYWAQPVGAPTEAGAETEMNRPRKSHKQAGHWASSEAFSRSTEFNSTVAGSRLLPSSCLLSSARPWGRGTWLKYHTKDCRRPILVDSLGVSGHHKCCTIHLSTWWHGMATQPPGSLHHPPHLWCPHNRKHAAPPPGPFNWSVGRCPQPRAWAWAAHPHPHPTPTPPLHRRSPVPPAPSACLPACLACHHTGAHRHHGHHACH
jgi:hypothetical protein